VLNLIIVLAALIQGLVGLFVYQKKPDSLTNRSFALLSFASLCWALTNFYYTLDPASSSALTITRMVMFWVVIQNTAFYIFAKDYPSSNLVISRRKLTLILTFSALTALATLSPYVFSSVTVTDNQANPNPAPLMGLFMLHAVFTIGGGLRSLIQKTRKASGQSKTQLQYILVAAILNWLVVPVTNFVITLAFHTTFFAKVSPLYTLLFASIIGYAIVAQKLFDIRAAVARSVAYLLVLGTISVVYGFIVFGVINVIFSGPSNEFIRQALSVLMISPLVLSFQTIKQFFDKTTNRIFFRDSYEVQDVLDRLGNVLVSEIELHRILKETRQTLSTALKSSFIEFVLLKEGKPYFEAHTHKTLSRDALKLGAAIAQQSQNLLIVDEHTGQTPRKQLYTDAGVALSLKLKTREQAVGYVIFGNKRSGDIYNAQDQRLLLILANELAIAIQNALRFEQIENFNLTLQAKVDEATRKLRHANEKLKELDTTKDDFISMASHQLRTPLTSVKGYLSMILEGDAGAVNKQQKDMLNQAFLSSQRMVYLIADLLNVSRLKTGKFVIEPAPANLASIIQEEIEQLKETASVRQLKLAYFKPKAFPELMLDETKTRQVLMNFIDNAIYYTPNGGQIEISLTDKPHVVEFRVKDNGIGVPKSEQPHLFTKFYRAGNARKARPDGTGLGLFMAKKVVVAQGGAIIFESKEGKGSTFGFTLSKAKLAVKTTI
jgi:signal transduction histidine kinase